MCGRRGREFRRRGGGREGSRPGGKDARNRSDGDSVSLALPADTVLGVLDNNTTPGQLLANLVGAGEVAPGAGRPSLGQQLLHLLIAQGYDYGRLSY